MNKISYYTAIAIGVAVCAQAEQVRFSELPTSAQKTINQNLDGGTVQEIDRKAQAGRTIYDVEIRREGLNKRLRVDADGKLLDGGDGKDARIDVETRVDEPEIKGDRDGKAEVKVDADVDDGELEVEAKRKKGALSKTDGKLLGVIPWRGKAQDHRDTDRNTVTRNTDGNLDTDKEDGRILGVPKRGFETISVKDVPQPVRATIEKAAPGAKIAEIELADHNGERVYEVDVERDGKNRELRIAKDGTLLSDSAGAIGNPGRSVKGSRSSKD